MLSQIVASIIMAVETEDQVSGIATVEEWRGQSSIQCLKSYKDASDAEKSLSIPKC